MTIQEVIDILKTGFDCILPMLEPVYKVAIEEALEKQIAKKPIKGFDDEVKEYWLSCPICLKGLWWERTAKDMEYCYRCGQKIDRN